MWHFSQGNHKDNLIAKQILFALEHTGLLVFPNFNTSWHFDDKVAQKYLFERIGAPLVSSYSFYSKSEALDWIEQTTFPKVFKLRGGAGSQNVQLIYSKNQAIKILDFWQKNNWCAEYQLSGPLEQAGSGMLLPILKIMKPIPAHYRFLMIRHQDELWKRHPDEI